MPNSGEHQVTPEQVFEVLQTCYDLCCKERAVSVVELGLIQNVKVAENGQDVRVELLLTSGWCPFSTHLLQDGKQTKKHHTTVGMVVPKNKFTKVSTVIGDKNTFFLYRDG